MKGILKMLKGKLVKLVSIERTDLKKLMEWRNDPYFRKHFREYRELNSSMQEKWYENKVLKDPSTMMFSIRRLRDNKLLGCCGFVYIHWAYRHADISLYIGDRRSYIDDKGYAEDACRIMLDYGFGDLNLNKVWTEIYEFDIKKRKLYSKIGFKLDGILRQNTFHNGRFWDSHMISILKNEWQKNNRSKYRGNKKMNRIKIKTAYIKKSGK